MDIACCTDKNYIMPIGVMITSLCENNREEEITFHIVSADITEEGKKDLQIVTEKYGKKICFYQIDKSLLNDLPIGKSWQTAHVQSIATYFRLFFSSVFPSEVEKVIYLDGDIIVSDSLKDLWNTDVSNCAIAAVWDVDINNVKHYNRLKYSLSLGYFNAGVLLINLAYWRAQNIEKEFFSIVQSYQDRLNCHDQDILNIVFKEQKKWLHPRFNLQNDFLHRNRNQKISWEFEEELNEAMRNPAIIHYIYGIKPWHKECSHPFRSEFLRYKAMTQWANVPLKYHLSLKKRMLKRIKYILKYVLCCCGLLDKQQLNLHNI